MKQITRFFNNHNPEPLDAADLVEHLKNQNNLIWVDLCNEELEPARKLLEETFGFHPLAVEDAIKEIHVPKIDDWDAYIYLVLCSIIECEPLKGEIKFEELDIFVGQNYLVTVHDHPMKCIDRLRNISMQDDRFARRGVEYLLFRLGNEIVADYMPVIEQIDQAIDEMEDQIFHNPHAAELENIFKIKRVVLELRRMLLPQRETLNQLALDRFQVIGERYRVLFRDIDDHFFRLLGLTESMRDLVSSVLDSYLSVINNRMNEIMKTLTMITTLFMPISFVAAFFGMNFFGPLIPITPGVGEKLYLLSLAFIILFPIGMFMWMRSRKWM
jgi:magnesium transporter